MLLEDRKYHLCNAHYKIWLAHDPEILMPYLYQDDFRQYREKNSCGYCSLVYSGKLLSNKGMSDLIEFAEKYKIGLISFEKDLEELTNTFGTEKDKQSYKLASYELQHYPDQKGGNLAIVSDLIRWSSVLLRKGNYADTDVKIGQHIWVDSISQEKSVALNLGSMIYPDMTVPWLNGDIIAGSSLFSKPHSKGDFRANSVIQKGGLLDLFQLHSEKHKNLIQRHLTFLCFLNSIKKSLKTPLFSNYRISSLESPFLKLHVLSSKKSKHLYCYSAKITCRKEYQDKNIS